MSPDKLLREQHSNHTIICLLVVLHYLLVVLSWHLLLMLRLLVESHLVFLVYGSLIQYLLNSMLYLL